MVIGWRCDICIVVVTLRCDSGVVVVLVVLCDGGVVVAL
jgi:hypothetical protein